MKIETLSDGATTTIRLIGEFQSAHISELKNQLRDNGPNCVLDLKEVTIVDLDVVRFLGACELEGVHIVCCSHYIRDWILREQEKLGQE
jgi:anti-anti-sigma regulatory factor